MEPIEQSFECPWCFENISMVIEPEQDEQSYIEDCEVCCRPIRLRFGMNDEETVWFEAERS